MEIKKILVPTDFSPCSINALKIAAGLAKGQNASIEIVHAVHVPAHPHVDVLAAQSIVEPILEDYEKKVDLQFNNLKKQIPELANVSFSIQKFVSLPSDAIHTVLSTSDIDLVVMGTKGSHDLLEKLVGSMSAEVIRFSKIPVLMIPENIKSLKIGSIAFAADLKEIKNPDQLDMLLFFAKASGAELTVFHFSNDYDDDHLEELARENMKLIHKLEGIKVSYAHLDEQTVSDGILKFIDKYKIDMLAMYPRHHGLWDRIIHTSTTRKIAMRIKTPLLTIHE
ncbi:MAG: universal stress protein [Cyclobacteriaceae bacterium]